MPNQLTNGHSQLFMCMGRGSWGSECQLKYQIAKSLARGDRDALRFNSRGIPNKLAVSDPPCKIVYIVMGDSEISEWIGDLKQAVKHNLPIILVKGSPMCDAFIDHINGKSKIYNGGSLDWFQEYEDLLDDGNFYCLESGKSEDLAAFAHFFLTVTPYGHKERDWKTDFEKAGLSTETEKIGGYEKSEKGSRKDKSHKEEEEEKSEKESQIGAKSAKSKAGSSIKASSKAASSKRR